jgi:hypothetical protein
MKNLFWIFVGLVVFPFVSVVAQETKPQGASKYDGPCRVMKMHCQCANPHRDFILKKQKVGMANPNEPGTCRSSKDIDEFLKTHAAVYCLRGGGYEKDPRKGETQCTATWECVQPCDVKDIGKSR